MLYSCAGAISRRWGKSWIASIKVLDFRRNRGELAATSAVLEGVVSKLLQASHVRQGLAHSQAISCENHILGSMVAYRRVSMTVNTTSNSRLDNIGVEFSLYCQEVDPRLAKAKRIDRLTEWTIPCLRDAKMLRNGPRLPTGPHNVY